MESNEAHAAPPGVIAPLGRVDSFAIGAYFEAAQTQLERENNYENDKVVSFCRDRFGTCDRAGPLTSDFESVLGGEDRSRRRLKLLHVRPEMDRFNSTGKAPNGIHTFFRRNVGDVLRAMFKDSRFTCGKAAAPEQFKRSQMRVQVAKRAR